jgi:TonB family protein
MKLLFLILLFSCTFAGLAQTGKKAVTPVQMLYGERTPDERRHGPVISGVLNMRILNEVLPVYPQRAKDKNIQGRVEVELLINEDGEVIFANPLSGPEGLWAECVKAAVTARFKPLTLEGVPSKVTGRVIFDFKKNTVELPYRNGFTP